MMNVKIINSKIPDIKIPVLNVISKNKKTIIGIYKTGMVITLPKKTIESNTFLDFFLVLSESFSRSAIRIANNVKLNIRNGTIPEMDKRVN